MSKRVPGHFIMPFGKYKGRTFDSVPASYLLYLYEENKLYGQVLSYVEQEKSTLELQRKNELKGIR